MSCIVTYPYLDQINILIITDKPFHYFLTDYLAYWSKLDTRAYQPLNFLIGNFCKLVQTKHQIIDATIATMK